MMSLMANIEDDFVKQLIKTKQEPNNQLNVYTTSVTEGEVACLKLVKPPVIHY